MPRILSINTGQSEWIELAGKRVRTAIRKHPAPGDVHLATLGAAGDQQADPRYHGGPDQALNVYPAEHQADWSCKLSLPPAPPGSYGENLTISGLLEADVCVGDVWRIGGALVQVTKPRAPCHKLEGVVGVKGFAAMASEAATVGWYLRVLEEGTARAGTQIEIVRRDPAGLTILMLWEIGLGRPVAGFLLRQALSAEGLPASSRKKIEQRLAQSK